MKRLRMVALVLGPLLVLGAWILTDDLVERSTRDLGPAVVVTGVVGPPTSTVDTTPVEPAHTTSVEPVDTSAPVPSAPSTVVPVDPAPPRPGAQVSEPQPTCPAGPDDDGDGDDQADIDDPVCDD